MPTHTILAPEPTALQLTTLIQRACVHVAIACTCVCVSARVRVRVRVRVFVCEFAMRLISSLNIHDAHPIYVYLHSHKH